MTGGICGAKSSGMKRERVYAYLKPQMKAHLDWAAAFLDESTSYIVEQALISHIGRGREEFETKPNGWSLKYGSPAVLKGKRLEEKK